MNEDLNNAEINNNDNNNNNNQTVEEPVYVVNENPAPPFVEQATPIYVDPTPMSPTISIMDWILTSIVMMIPCVNIIMIFVYAFSGKKDSKKNYFKAQLIIGAISILITLVFSIIGIILLRSAVGDLGDWINQIAQEYDSIF